MPTKTKTKKRASEAVVDAGAALRTIALFATVLAPAVAGSCAPSPSPPAPPVAPVLTICKTTSGTGNGNFSFNWTVPFGPNGAFSLNTGGCQTLPMGWPFIRVTESITYPWALTNIVCVPMVGVAIIPNPNPLFQPGDYVVRVKPKQTSVTCTFTNISY